MIKNLSKDFWKRYIKSDEIKRLEQVKILSKLFESSYHCLLKSYFDDLIEYMEEDIIKKIEKVIGKDRESCDIARDLVGLKEKLKNE